MVNGSAAIPRLGGLANRTILRAQVSSAMGGATFVSVMTLVHHENAVACAIPAHSDRGRAGPVVFTVAGVMATVLICHDLR